MSSGLISQLKNLEEVEGEVAHRNEKILDEIRKLGTHYLDSGTSGELLVNNEKCHLSLNFL